MQLLEVIDDNTIELFHKVPGMIYKNDPYWIPHVFKEIEHIFDRNQNRSFENGNAKRWVLLNRNFETVGRIAAFYSNSNSSNVKGGGIGFYECKEDDNYSEILLDNAECWLKDHGMEFVDGPVNFGERHQFWGCRTWGHTEIVYQENYNPPYYNDQFLFNGFSPLFESLTYVGSYETIPQYWIQKLHDRVKKKNFSYAKFNMDKVDQFVEDYLTIAAESFDHTNRTVNIDKNTIINLLNIQKGVLRDDLICFAYDERKPVGVVGFMLNWSDILYKAMKFNSTDKYISIKGFLVAVLPKYQRTNVLIGLIYHLTQAILADKTIDKIFISGITGHSKNIRSILDKLNATLIIRHLTFRKYFDGRKVEAYPLSILT